MKYLIILSAIIYSVASSHLENGAYSYQYHTDQGSRSEIRHPNGQITGAYQYVDNNMLHKLKYTSGPNKDVKIISHNTVGVIPNNVYHDSQVSYRRNIINEEIQNEADQISAFPPVYIRHVPSPVKHEPIVPIIDVAAPLNSHYVAVQSVAPARRTFETVAPTPAPSRRTASAIAFESPAPAPAPEIRSFKVEHTPEVTYELRPTPALFIPHYITSHETHNKEVFHAPERVEGRPLLGADVPLTHDGLTYEVAKARDQHFAAIAAVKATLPAVRA